MRIEPNEVMSSARAAALWLARERPNASVHVCGTGELEDELRVAGVRVVAADRCDVVLVGMNPELRYRDLADALEPLLRGALFVICNRDPNYPVEDGRRVPGSGAVVGALEAASERRADVVIGKPSSIALAELCTSLDVDPGACIVVGDSITSDIEMARRMGLPSILITPEEAAPPDGATMRTALSLGDAVSIVLELAGDGAPPARPGPAT